MRYLRLFENFQGLQVGDMVYVNLYQANNNEWLRGDRFVSYNYSFYPNVKYEIIFIEESKAILYDNENNVAELPLDNLFKEKIDWEYVKDCFDSSFEDVFESVRIKNYVDAVYIYVTNNSKDFNWQKAEDTFRNEFRPRIQDDGYVANLKIISRPRRGITDRGKRNFLWNYESLIIVTHYDHL